MSGPRRPWFGPKRIGWGYRPQTWQGCGVVLALATLAVVAGLLAAR